MPILAEIVYMLMGDMVGIVWIIGDMVVNIVGIYIVNEMVVDEMAAKINCKLESGNLDRDIRGNGVSNVINFHFVVLD